MNDKYPLGVRILIFEDLKQFREYSLEELSDSQYWEEVSSKLAVTDSLYNTLMPGDSETSLWTVGPKAKQERYLAVIAEFSHASFRDCVKVMPFSSEILPAVLEVNARTRDIEATLKGR